jgi:uncharacterized protein (DUF4415 family)
MSARASKKRLDSAGQPRRGRADLDRLRRMTDAEIQRMAPPELADLSDDFWDDAAVVTPAAKQAISLRVDEDVLSWFKLQGPRYQTRMNAVLRTYMKRQRSSTPSTVQHWAEPRRAGVAPRQPSKTRRNR